MKTCITHCRFGSHLTTVRKYVNCGGRLVFSGNGDNDAPAVNSESRPWLEKWDLKSDAFSDSVAFNPFFLLSLPSNECHLKVHPLPSGQQAAARREFWDFDAAETLKEIFLDAAGLQLNSTEFLSTLHFSQLHCSTDDLNCTALNHIWVHCNMLHIFQILFYIL